MNSLKWFVFLPLAALLIALAQLVTGMIVQNTPWWLGLPLVFFFGVIVAMAGMLPLKMVSDPKIAATVLITLFVLFEGISLMGIASSLPTKGLVGRILVDIQILAGAFAGARRDGTEAIRKPSTCF
jgi:hypothetical protein